MAYKLQDRFALTFFIQLNQQYWSNFTSIQAGKGRTFYFSNEDIRKEDERYLLQKKNEVSEEDTIQLISSMNEVLIAGDSVESIKLEKRDGANESHDYAIKLINNKLSLNTRLLDEGAYELNHQEGKVEHFFFTKRHRFV